MILDDLSSHYNLNTPDSVLRTIKREVVLTVRELSEKH